MSNLQLTVMTRPSVVLLLLGIFAAVSAKRQVPLPSPPAPSPPPPGTPPAPTASYNAPGIQFSVDVAGFIASTFGTEQRNLFCGKLQNATTPYSSTCSIGTVTTTSSSYPGVVTVDGILSYNLYNPDQNTVFAATASRDILIQSLTNNATSVLAPLIATKNCDCLGPNTAPTINSPAVFSYTSPNGLEITAMAGARCGGRLAYPSTGNAGDVIGVNNGAANIADKFKYCSNPAIVGGTTGTPGTSPCVKYGVTNGYSSQATAGTPTVANAALSAVTLTTGGAGYASSQAAAISLTVAGGTAATVPAATDCKITSVTGAGPYTVLLADSTGTCEFAASGSGYNQASPPTFTLTGATSTNTLTGCTLPASLVSSNDGSANAGKIVVTASSLANIAFTCTANSAAMTTGEDVTFSSLSNFPSSTAPTVTPVIQGGQITALTVGNQGPAYGQVTITMPAPSSSSSGQLCTNAGNIPGANPTSFILQPTGAPAATGTCLFIGADTGAQKVCGTPVPPDGVSGVPGKGSCSVQNSWIAQCNGGLNACPSSTSYTCGILPQSFITNRTPPPPAPAPGPTPIPAPQPGPVPAPIPAPTPAPTPPAPLVCTYRGIYEIIPLYAPCNRYRIAAGTDSDCDYNLVTLRTAGQVGQGKIARLHWEFATIAEDNLSVPTNVLSRSRTGCTNKYLAAPSDPTTLKTGGSSWKWQFVPYPGSTKCDEVNVISQNRLSTTAFLQVPKSCDRFRYNATDGGRQRFRLRKITL